MTTPHEIAVALVLAMTAALVAAPAAAQTKIKNCTTITESGPYVVEKNITASGDCIVIETTFVDLDLGGFLLQGDGTGSGVIISTSLEDPDGIAVRNGSVTNFATGIRLNGALGAVVQGVRAYRNTGDGIRSGSAAIVTDNLAFGNGGTGIVASGRSTLARNTSSDNGSHGIDAGSCVIVNNTSGSNDGDGIHSVGGSSVITGNTVFRNAGNAISVSVGVVRGNTASSNQGSGISAICPSSIVGNVARSNVGPDIATTGSGCVQSDNATD